MPRGSDRRKNMDNNAPGTEITFRVPEADIPLRDVPGIVSKIFNCEPVSRQTVYQWASQGRQAANGRIIKLETDTRLGRMHTTLEWVKAFIEAL